MFARSCIRGLSFIGLGAVLVAGLIGCTNPTGLDSIQVSPASQSLAVGQTAQLTATGTYGNSSHLSTQNITSGVTWNSSSPAVATVSSSGMVTAVGAGTTTITANAQAYNGPTTSSATISVSSAGGTVSGGSVTSISVIPGSQSVSAPGQTSQFLAIGTTSSGATADLTSQVAWSSSSVQIATIASTGLATAVSQGSTTITAIYNAGSGSVVTGTGTFAVTGGTKEAYTAVSITPNSQSVSASGQTSQLIALGTSGSTGLEEDVTNSSSIKWSSSVPSIATVSASGLVTGASVGSTTITAVLTNPDGSVVSGTASVAVNSTPAPEPLLSLQIIPSSLSVLDLQGTGNFLAIGTFSTPPYVRDLTNSVTWLSSAPNVFPVINSNNSGANPGVPAGTATAYGSGGATIIAEAIDPTTGSVQTATATFSCPLVLPNPPLTAGSCFPGSQAAALLATVTVYNEGLNTTNWEVTAPSATGTANVIHCGPGWTGAGGSVCVATYPVGTTVTLTAPDTGAKFGGWSSSCTTVSPSPSSQAGPNTCSFTITDSNPNITIGAIFN